MFGNYAFNMRKLIGFIILIGLLFNISALPVKASLLTVKKDGSLVFNVLSAEDSASLSIPQSESLKVKEIASTEPINMNGKISLGKDGENFTMNVATSQGEKALDVTNFKGDLVEIEERPTVRSIKVGLSDGQFFLKEGEVTATTLFPINIDPAIAEISVTTDSGVHYLAIFPKEAIDIALKARVLSATANENIQILEENKGTLTYEIKGEKTLNLFNLFKYNIPVSISVSPLTGEIVNIDQPVWLKIVSYFFS